VIATATLIAFTAHHKHVTHIHAKIPTRHVSPKRTKQPHRKPIDNWHVTTLTVTAYVVNPAETGKCDVYHSRTATGTIPAQGTAAVDPSVFPFGTVFQIPGYGHAVALDTGGAVSGHIVDLVFPTCKSAFAWGRRTIKARYYEPTHVRARR
jgi:3D (Asp-Asp-Asp) domain-containing protein